MLKAGGRGANPEHKQAANSIDFRVPTRPSSVP